MGTYCTSLQDLKNKYNEYNNKCNDRKIGIQNYYNDIQEKEALIPNYRVIASELNNELSNIKDQSNISSSWGINDQQQTLKEDEKIYTLNDLEEITNEINEFQNLLENQKTLLKNLENNFKMIQEQFNDIDKKFQNKEAVNKELIDSKIDSLNKYLEENQQLIIKLKDNKRLYEQKKTKIENELEKMQETTNKKISEIKLKKSENFKKIYLGKSIDSDLNKSTSLIGSMLFDIKDSTSVKKGLKTIYLFREKENKDNKYESPLLLMKNWYEICYIYNDYDIHDITYELKAVGLPKFMSFYKNTLFFDPDISNKSIDILLFEIDGKKENYQFDKYFINFNIHLENLESNKIHIKYKESPKYEKMTEKEKSFRNIYRIKKYGLFESLAIRLIGQKAKYILKNESDLEIINFENEIFFKIKDNEYQWGGEVPEGGKVTKVRMSKKEGIVNYSEKIKIKTIDDSSIKYSNLKIPLCYIDGNNETIRNEYKCDPKGEINLGRNEQNGRIYDVYFKNTDRNTAEFKLEGELKNKCRTDWSINLTDEEIDSLVPPDFKTNKEAFNKKANEIINKYNEEHKDDSLKIPDIVKIGKWINKNIIYDMNNAGRNEITAYQTLNEKRGVCDHKTKLFNALAYSLGYQVIYANGFAMNKKNTFGMEDNHAWSIIKIKGKWLPFDATWGIFTGKLPVTHVYKKIGNEGHTFTGTKKEYAEPPYVEGSIR